MLSTMGSAILSVFLLNGVVSEINLTNITSFSIEAVFCLVLSIIGEYIGTTIGIHSPIPY